MAQSVNGILSRGGFDGFTLRPEILSQTASDIGEQTIISRTGGAPTFAIGLTLILHKIIGGAESMAFWYHFAILFEALFILTAVDAGTRTGRFLIQDILGNIYKPMADTKSWLWGTAASFICVCGWGYLLYQGTIDPLGGIFTLWALFGAANQMLAGIALLLGTVVLFKMGKAKYSWVTIIPAFWVLLTTLYVSFQKLLPQNGDKIHDAVSHIATAQKWMATKAQAIADGNDALVARASAIISNNILDAVLCAFFMIVVFVVLFECIKICYLSLQSKASAFPLKEEPYKKAKDYELGAHNAN